MSLLLSEKPDAAIPQLKEAIRLDPLEPRTPYLNLLGMAYFSTGNYAAALYEFNQNIKRGGPTGPHMDLYRASTLIELGRKAEAQILLTEIAKSVSSFRIEKWLGKWLSKTDYDRTITNLYLAGLPQNNLN